MRDTYRYTDGRRYRPIQARLAPATDYIKPYPAIDIHHEWSAFWEEIKRALRKEGYQLSTLKTYRQVLRSFRTFIKEHARSNSPRSATRKLMNDFLWQLTRQECSWSWISTNISVIRTSFDKLGNRDITSGIRSPKRRYPLSDILSGQDIAKMISVAPRPRDKLLIGLMYGTGMKVGEIAALRWQDIEDGVINVSGPRARQLPLPEGYIPLMEQGKELCGAGEYIFRGRAEGSHLSTRTIERIIKKAASDAEILKVVCCMTLRHSYAVACLKSGVNLLQLQLDLGQKHLETTEEYLRYIPGSTPDSMWVETSHPTTLLQGIDISELNLPFPAEDDAFTLYAFLSSLPSKLLFRISRKPG